MYFLIVLGLLKNWNLIEWPNIFFMCNIIISSTFWSPLFFIFRKIFMALTMMLMLFIFFFFRKIYVSFASVLALFVFFFFGKIFIPFTSLFLKPFFVFQIISGWHFIWQKYLIDFLYIYFCFKIFNVFL